MLNMDGLSTQSSLQSLKKQPAVPKAGWCRKRLVKEQRALLHFSSPPVHNTCSSYRLLRLIACRTYSVRGIKDTEVDVMEVGAV